MPAPLIPLLLALAAVGGGVWPLPSLVRVVPAGEPTEEVARAAEGSEGRARDAEARCATFD